MKFIEVNTTFVRPRFFKGAHRLMKESTLTVLEQIFICLLIIWATLLLYALIQYLDKY